MKCKKCSNETHVTETRVYGKNAMRRRRVCKKCLSVFYTLELDEVELGVVRAKQSLRPSTPKQAAERIAAVRRAAQQEKENFSSVESSYVDDDLSDVADLLPGRDRYGE